MVPNLLEDVLHRLPGLKHTLPLFGGKKNKANWPDWFKSPELYPVYQKLANALQPRSILEIGALCGYSLISMLDGSDLAEEICWVDNESYQNSSNFICKANILWYWTHFRPGKGLKVDCFTSIDGLNDTFPGKYDLIHIDGDHTFKGKLRDLTLARYLEPKWIILDDYFKLDEVRKAVCDWSKENKLKYYIVDMFERGLTIFDLNGQNLKQLLKENGMRVILEGTCL